MSYNTNQHGPRLPFPEEEAKKRGITPESWNVLCGTIFANAMQVRSILSAFDTAKAKGLDVFKGHLAIVSQNANIDGNWTKVEVVWPTQKSLVFTAHRTGAFAGMDPVEYGPSITKVFKGNRYNNGRNEAAEQSVTFPEWVSVTVYRLVGNARCPFTETVFYEEAASFSKNLPTPMWSTKPRMMLGKCAKAAALRIAFAECDTSAEEMDGKTVGADAEILTFPSGAHADASHPDQDGGVPFNGTPSDKGSDDQQGGGKTDFGSDFDPGNPDEPVTAWSDVDATTLDNVQRKMATAVSTGAFGPTHKDLRASLEPRYHQLCEGLISASQSVVETDRQAVRKWVCETIRTLEAAPGKLPDACAYVDRQVAADKLHGALGGAVKTVLTFHAACAAKIADRAA